MAYSDFSLEEVVEAFSLKETQAKLFESFEILAPSSWLETTLELSFDLGIASGNEKARSEFIVVPVLLEMERRNHKKFTIYSGKNLDVDRSKGLCGECDFMFSKGALSRTVQAPIFSLVEAKKQDIDLGLGQCVAQMVSADLFNQHKGNPIPLIFGCVTTGEIWQFLKLGDRHLVIDSDTYYINELGKILGLLQTILDHYL
jgi:hypothetical protein